jgi:quercetin dioxygenase-like cupin family protein
MHRVLFLVAVFSVVAFTAKAQDPVKVDPEHYKVEFENDQARVLRVHFGPKESSPMHEFPPSARVCLTDGSYKWTLADGKTEEHTCEAGWAGYRPAQKHAFENLSDKDFEVIIAELKSNPVATQPGGTRSALDPTKVDPRHHKVEVENDQVRVLRMHLGPKESSPMHEHPPAVLVLLTDARLKITLADGKTEERTRTAGEARYRPAEKHAVENLNDKDYEIIIVELKAQPAAVKAPAAKN